MGPEEGEKDDQRAAAPLLQREVEGDGVDQHGEDSRKTSLQPSRKGLQERWVGTIRGCNDRTRSSGFKPTESRFRLDIRKKPSKIRVMRHQNTLHREAVDAPSPEVFKPYSWMGRCPCSWQGIGTGLSFKVPSNPSHSVMTPAHAAS